MKKNIRQESIPNKVFFTIIKLVIIATILVIGLNVYVIKSNEQKIAADFECPGDTANRTEINQLKSISPECILVLGASVNPDRTPSPMLKDRLDTAIDLYHQGVAPKMLFSGDNGQIVYNEVQTMKDYALERGVKEEDIFLDHAGFSTYESVYRAKYIFKIDSMVAVTQTYHLYRTLHGCEKMGIKAMGAASDQYTYGGQEKREVREVLARDKDFVKWIFKPQPTFLGDAIPITNK